MPQGSILAPLLYIFFIRCLPTEVSNEIVTSFYADDTTYAASDTPHSRRKTFVSTHLQEILINLEKFCSQWRIKLNPDKTWCFNFYSDNKNKNYPRLWLKGEPLKYKTECKFLGITFDEKMTFEKHIDDVVTRAQKRLNLLKAIRGQNWGASPQTILYTYRTYVRPLLEYGCILYSNDDKILKKLQSIETQAIKIAHRLPPWATNTWCYELISFDNISARLKTLSKSFIEKNSHDELIKPLLEDLKPSMTGLHSPIYKTMNF